MVVSKSGAQMDYWREYFRSANANIFEIIEKAIMLAASDCPKEFKNRRDNIAQILFNCKLVKCSGCDKEELALPAVDNQEDDDDGKIIENKLTNVNANCSKESSKVINCSRIDDNDDDDVDRDDDYDDDDDVKANESNQVSNYSYGDAEALTDELEQESQTFGEVMRIKDIVDNSPDESPTALCNSLRKLQLMAISVETLKATEIGKSVNVLRKNVSKEVRQLARTLIETWKYMVDEWVDATTKMTVSEATPDSMNPSVVDEEEGLPSPPLDDLAFLNPHSMSLELNEFFDGMDDFGNPRTNCRKPVQRNNDVKPPVEKQNLTKWKQQKPSNALTMVPKPSVVKPSKPLVADSTLGRPMKPNMDRKLQTIEKTTPLKRPLAPPQRKPTSASEETCQDRLEVATRKLQERYKQAENAKRQRTIQVMELQDLPKQSIAPKNQNIRPGNNHNRHRANGRH